MKKHLVNILLLVLSLNIIAQDTTTISVIKKGEKEIQTGDLGSSLNQASLYRWKPWMVWDGSTQVFRPQFDIFPSLGLEYDLSKKETAHFYNLGADVGTERLMMGMVFRIASHNPRLEDQGGIQMAFRLIKRWDFRKIRTTQLRIVQKRIAHVQVGMEYIFDTQVNSSISEGIEPQRVSFLSPSIGVFHPIYEKYLVGLKFKRNFTLNNSMGSYSDLSVNFSYFFGL